MYQILSLSLLLILSGCASNQDLVNPGENAAVCIKARIDSPNPLVSTTIEIKYIQLPENFNISQLTIDSLTALEEAICP